MSCQKKRLTCWSKQVFSPPKLFPNIDISHIFCWSSYCTNLNLWAQERFQTFFPWSVLFTCSCVGTFTVDRLPAINTLSPPMPTNRLHIIRHKRRKLTIHPFEVDPDAEAALVEAESSPGNSSTASLLCGGPPKNDNKIYDFWHRANAPILLLPTMTFTSTDKWLLLLIAFYCFLLSVYVSGMNMYLQN